MEQKKRGNRAGDRGTDAADGVPEPAQDAYAALSSSGLLEVRRSRRRRTSVSAFREGAKTIVAIPAHFSAEQEQEWVRKMVARLERKLSVVPRSDADLMERALRLSDEYLGGAARPRSVLWVTNQNSRWGSTTPSTGAIRLSHRLQVMPQWAADYVIVHELAHRLEANHGRAFWRLVAAYPQTDRARAYLEGFSHGMSYRSAELAAPGSPGPQPSQPEWPGAQDGSWNEDLFRLD
jgi:predicted metal-dependent hydrolase